LKNKLNNHNGGKESIREGPQKEEGSKGDQNKCGAFFVKLGHIGGGEGSRRV